MKKLQRNFTNQEQSKRLLELGVPADSADMCYKINNELMRFDRIPTAIPYKDFTAKELYCPCWSVGRLIEILEITLGTPWSDNEELGESTLLERVVRDLEYVVKYKEIFKDNRIDFSKLEE